MKKKTPQQVMYYFEAEWKTLLIVTLTGIVYNLGLVAGPIFEGRLVGCLLDILTGKAQFGDMLALALGYVAVITVVQVNRYLKRLYVRRFANNTNRRMKEILYGNLVCETVTEAERGSVGSIMTKAVSDVDACVEGMRKFTTELFDTGLALAGYIGLLLYYDRKLALLCLIFPPVSYYIAEKMKRVVQTTNAAYKESASALNSATLDRIANSMTYRVFGCEGQRAEEYENDLKDYERKAVMANIWVQSMPPLYQVISMLSVIFIVCIGSENIGAGTWDIAMFTTFLSCFTKLSVKSSKAAKLFNSVHKAEISWKRINSLLKPAEIRELPETGKIRDIRAEGLGFEHVFSGLSFTAERGQIIGITGPVACGKTVLGRILLGELPYSGSLRLVTDEEKEISETGSDDLAGYFGYIGHKPELFSDSIKENILMGDDVGELKNALDAAALSDEVQRMPEKENTRIGSGGILLSGGQQQRTVLARTLSHPKQIYVLDDPFSALDRKTEAEVFENLRKMTTDSLVFLISHRLYVFPQLDGVIWMNDGKAAFSDHVRLMNDEPGYRELYEIQTCGERGGSDE